MGSGNSPKAWRVASARENCFSNVMSKRVSLWVLSA